jgi:uncharacterized Ntn-hydrolase superfamily protein
MQLSTFSLVAYDPANGDLGIAVASKFLAVGSVVPWAQAGIGAIATQAWANTRYVPLAFEMLKLGLTPEQVGAALTNSDEAAPQRQFGLVDAQGRVFTFTGSGCYTWAGGHTGKHYAAQGNILAGPAVIDALAITFEHAEGDLAERLLAALEAGQRAGGDKRGQESAALLVVRAGGGYGGFNDRYIDLRVDDHSTPVAELKRLLELHRLYLTKSDPNDLVAIDDHIARELQTLMAKRGYPVSVSGIWDEPSQMAFRELGGVENLEERIQDGPFIDRVVLKFIRERFK